MPLFKPLFQNQSFVSSIFAVWKINSKLSKPTLARFPPKKLKCHLNVTYISKIKVKVFFLKKGILSNFIGPLHKILEILKARAKQQETMKNSQECDKEA